MENKETLFLAKLQLIMTTFDELDKMCETNPTEQQSVDFEISDYLHLLQNEDLTEDKMLEIAKKLKSARQRRAQLYNVSQLMKAYNLNKSKLPYENNRYCMDNAIKNAMKTLNLNYNYRVLDEETIQGFKEKIVENIKPQRKRRNKYDITKEELEEKIEHGMTNKEIAEELGCDGTYISVLKRKFNLDRRGYKKRG